MDKIYDLGHDRLLETLLMDWCIPLPLEWTTCGHWVMGTLEETRPNPVLLVRIVMHDHYLIGSNIPPGIPIHQIVNRPAINYEPHQYHALKQRAHKMGAHKMGAHIPEYLLVPASRVDYRLVSLPRFASTPTMSEVGLYISRPRNRTRLRP